MELASQRDPVWRPAAEDGQRRDVVQQVAGGGEPPARVVRGHGVRGRRRGRRGRQRARSGRPGAPIAACAHFSCACACALQTTRCPALPCWEHAPAHAVRAHAHVRACATRAAAHAKRVDGRACHVRMRVHAARACAQVLDLLVNDDSWLDRAAFGWLPERYLRMMPRMKHIVPVIDHDRGVAVSGPGKNSPIRPTLPPHAA